MGSIDEELTIIIEQLQERPADPLRSTGAAADSSHPSWNAQIYIFDKINVEATPVKQWPVVIHDPFPQSDHDKIAHYLNKILIEQYWNTDQDEKIHEAKQLLRDYSECLLQSLEIHDAWRSMNKDSARLGQRRFKLEIVSNTIFFEGRDHPIHHPRAFHCIHWELLEDLEIWKRVNQKHVGASPEPTSVRVRRRIDTNWERTPGRDIMDTIRPRITSWSQNDRGVFRQPTFKVLLIVARDVTRAVDPWSPTIIQVAVLKIREQLLSKGDQRRIEVKVSRPGSVERLKSILDKATRFNAIHFDMHGRVSPYSSRAELQFNEDAADELTENWVDGATIAKLLKHHTQCVILGACKSADANAQAYANLAWVFIKGGISNVVAMSFNMIDTMSETFFNKFYHELFIEHQELAEAARVARSVLLECPQRYHYNTRQWKCIGDWFVPVVYSNGSSFYAEDKRKLFTSAKFMAQLRHQLLSSNTFLWTIVCPVCLAVYLYDQSQKLLLRMLIPSLIFGLSLLCRSANKQWQSWKNASNSELATRAFDWVMEDKTNVLRLENDLWRARKVYFYDTPATRTANSARNSHALLQNLIPLWERTTFVNGVVELSHRSFEASWSMHLWYAELRIWWQQWRSTQNGSESHLIVVIEAIDELYYADPSEPQSLMRRARFENWLDKNFNQHGGQASPYLIMTGYSRAGASSADRPGATKKWASESFVRVTALRNMAVTMFFPTEIAYWRIRPSTATGRADCVPN